MNGVCLYAGRPLPSDVILGEGATCDFSSPCCSCGQVEELCTSTGEGCISGCADNPEHCVTTCQPAVIVCYPVDCGVPGQPGCSKDCTRPPGAPPDWVPTTFTATSTTTSTTTPTAPHQFIPGQLCNVLESPCCHCKPGPPICDGVLCDDDLIGSPACSLPGCQPAPDACRYVDCVAGQPGCDPQCYRQQVSNCIQPGRDRAPSEGPTSGQHLQLLLIQPQQQVGRRIHVSIFIMRVN